MNGTLLWETLDSIYICICIFLNIFFLHIYVFFSWKLAVSVDLLTTLNGVVLRRMSESQTKNRLYCFILNCEFLLISKKIIYTSFSHLKNIYFLNKSHGNNFFLFILFYILRFIKFNKYMFRKQSNFVFFELCDQNRTNPKNIIFYVFILFIF